MLGEWLPERSPTTMVLLRPSVTLRPPGAVVSSERKERVNPGVQCAFFDALQKFVHFRFSKKHAFPQVIRPPAATRFATSAKVIKGGFSLPLG